MKAPRTKRLKLECDELLSNFAFNFNLRRYTQAVDKFELVAAPCEVAKLVEWKTEYVARVSAIYR